MMFIQQFFNSRFSWKYLSNYVLCKMHLNRMLLFFSPCNYFVSHLVFHSTMCGDSGFSLLNVFMLAHCTLCITLLCVLLLRHCATWFISSVPFPVCQVTTCVVFCNSGISTDLPVEHASESLQMNSQMEYNHCHQRILPQNLMTSTCIVLH